MAVPRGPAPMTDRRRGSTASSLAGRSSRLDCLASPPSTPEALPAAWLDAATSAPPSSAAGSSAPCTSRPCAGSASTWSACSGSTQDRAAAAGRAGRTSAHAYGSLDELLADDRVQVVHVTSPNELHYPQVKAILAAGRHVVCEKPLAMTAAESGDLVRLARGQRPRQRGQLQHPLLPAQPARGGVRPRRRRRRRPAGHRPLLPGLAALRHRLELAARAATGAARCGRWATSAPTGST